MQRKNIDVPCNPHSISDKYPSPPVPNLFESSLSMEVRRRRSAAAQTGVAEKAPSREEDHLDVVPPLHSHSARQMLPEIFYRASSSSSSARLALPSFSPPSLEWSDMFTWQWHPDVMAEAVERQR